MAIDIAKPLHNSDQLDMTFMALLDTSNNMTYDMDMLDSEGNLFSISEAVSQHATTNHISHSNPTTPANIPGQGSAPTFAEVPIHEGAQLFQVYFEVIHPRYPFLDVEECSRGYQDWQTGEIFAPSSGVWRSYLVKMIFAIGSLLRQAKLDFSTRQQHHNLMLQAQADQTLLTDESYRPVVRLQAILLHAIHALHRESTPRVVHITGVAMRFAVMKGFDCLVHDGTEETALAIKAWWCIYSLDKVVAIALQIPPYPAEDWISTPVFVNEDEPRYRMPWSADVPSATASSTYHFNLA